VKLSQELLEPGRLSLAVSNSLVLPPQHSGGRQPTISWTGCRRGRRHNPR
jgi:hypothetical protein